MKETQETINRWQHETFPEATTQGITRHLIEELDELKEKLEELSSPTRKPQLSDVFETALEAADAIILIYAWAAEHGIVDIHTSFVDWKMFINRNREWNIQSDGTGRHK